MLRARFLGPAGKSAGRRNDAIIGRVRMSTEPRLSKSWTCSRRIVANFEVRLEAVCTASAGKFCSGGIAARPGPRLLPSARQQTEDRQGHSDEEHNPQKPVQPFLLRLIHPVTQ